MPYLNSPKLKSVISSPRVLSRFSPVANIIRTSSQKKKRHKIDRAGSMADVQETKSKFIKCNPCNKPITNEEDFTSTMSEEFSTMLENHIKTLPILKINSNNLNWLKEQKPSKNSTLTIQTLSGDAVRTTTETRKVSKFYVQHLEPKDNFDFDDIEEFKSSTDESPSSFSLYCECGNICIYGKTLCNLCTQKQELLEKSGYLYIEEGKGIKQIWVHLLNKELYCKYVNKIRL